MKYHQARDLDGPVSLYEPNAHFDPLQDTHLVGTEAIRHAPRQLIDSGVQLKLELRDPRVAGALTLVPNTATLTGAMPELAVSNTTEALRGRPDGGRAHPVGGPFLSWAGNEAHGRTARAQCSGSPLGF
ncbi:hypothetical protein AB0E08_48425 [Streptomyces sp. NPDC048281]|uniref:hypothetical protein n=1 Tax=Streptomyces sp. NPDC048281 TaxID=3154715 RepID=UPI00343FC108